MTLKNKKIIIIGASFIGSHLIPKLIKKGIGHLRLVNLTDKHKYLFMDYLNEAEFLTLDVRDTRNALKSVKGMDLVIHLACDHGGRGYIETNQGKMAENLLLDGSVFHACIKQNVQKLFYASSACVYPRTLQNDLGKEIYLKEEMVRSPYDADTMYGWGKLMGELTLKAYFKDFGLDSVIGRFFTVYGEGANESHAVIATIAKAFIKQHPFQIWGDGNQIRNWTYVKDIADGIVLALERADKAIAVNLGTSEKIKVSEMVNEVLKYTHFFPNKITYIPNPVGPLNRVSDNSLAYNLLGWKPKYFFSEGLKRTIKWYFDNHSRSVVNRNLDRLLMDST